MSTTAIPVEILPEQIDGPAPDAVAVAATDLTRRYGEGDTAVDALRGVFVDVAQGRLTAIDPDHSSAGLARPLCLRVTEPEQDDEAERERRASERLETDLTRRYGEGATAVHALRGVFVDVAEGRLTAINPDHSSAGLARPLCLRVTEPEQDDEAEREKRASERLDVDDLPRAPVEPEAGEDQT